MTAERTAARREENLFIRGQFSGKYGVCVCVFELFIVRAWDEFRCSSPFYVVSIIIFFPVGNRRLSKRVPEKQRQKAATGNVF